MTVAETIVGKGASSESARREPPVGAVREIRKQHALLFGLVGEFNVAAKAGAVSSQLMLLLHEILDCMKSHSAAEEAVLAEMGHPGLTAQRIDHHNLLDYLMDFDRQLVAGQLPPVEDLIHLLDPLIVHHLRDEQSLFGRDWP